MILVVAASTFVFACDKDKSEKTFKSEETTVFGGKAWSTITVKDDVPQQVSLVLNDAVLNTAPAGTPGEMHNPANDFIIPLAPKALQTTLFKFIMLNWNPNGHEPEHIYTLPHFDMHFYETSANEVMAYTDQTKLDSEVPAGYIPANHISGPGIPMMGKHYIDATSGELNGQTFTQTFLYGSYDSKVVFYEPMITLDFLKNTTNFERSVPQPTKFEKTGYYPTRLKIVKHDGLTEIILSGFTKRQAS